MLTIKQTQYVNKDNYKCTTTIEESFPTLTEKETRSVFAGKVLQLISAYNFKYSKAGAYEYLFTNGEDVIKVQLINDEKNEEV